MMFAPTLVANIWLINIQFYVKAYRVNSCRREGAIIYDMLPIKSSFTYFDFCDSLNIDR